MIVNKIAYWAEKKGMKHNYLAKECGVSVQTFSRWSKNKTQPDLIQSYILSKLLDVPLIDLIEDQHK